MEGRGRWVQWPPEALIVYIYICRDLRLNAVMSSSRLNGPRKMPQQRALRRRHHVTSGIRFCLCLVWEAGTRVRTSAQKFP